MTSRDVRIEYLALLRDVISKLADIAAQERTQAMIAVGGYSERSSQFRSGAEHGLGVLSDQFTAELDELDNHLDRMGRPQAQLEVIVDNTPQERPEKDRQPEAS